MRTLTVSIVALACGVVAVVTAPRLVTGSSLPDQCVRMVSLNTMESTPESIADIHCAAGADRVVTCSGVDRDAGARSRVRSGHVRQEVHP